jgi:hypothetical protein
MAYTARQRIKKTAFEELRSACLRLGSQLTTTPGTVGAGREDRAPD